jgi:hypothetical protein
MKAHALLTAALVAGVMACSSDPVGPSDTAAAFTNPAPNLVTITGQVMIENGEVVLHVFDGRWVGQDLRLAGARADELRTHVGEIVRVKGTLRGVMFDVDEYDMVFGDERGRVH